MIDVIVNIAIGILALTGICVIAPAAMMAWMWWKERNDEQRKIRDA